MILLYCDHESGQIALPAGCVEGISVGERRYCIASHVVAVDGAGYDRVAVADAAVLCQQAHLRFATPSEQNAYTAAQNATGTLREEQDGAKKPKATKSNGG